MGSPSRARLWLALGLVMIEAVLLGRSVPRLAPQDPHAFRAGSERSLSPGTSVQRSLHGGEAHVYRIDLKAGQVLQAEVVQRRIDVVVSLLGPDGAALIEVDSPNADRGSELVFAVAATSGGYELVVLSRKESKVKGNYLLRIDALRPAGERDRFRAAATLAFSTGEMHRRTKTEEGFRKAVVEHGKALRLWEILGDTDKQATTLDRLGWIRQDQGMLSAALPLFLRALQLGRDPRERTIVLNRLGKIYSSLGEPHKGVEACQRALALARQTGDPWLEAGAWQNLGAIYWSWGQLAEAGESFQAALASYRKAGYPSPAYLLENLGALYLGLGNPRRALAFCQQALDLHQAAGDPLGEAWSLRCMAWAFNGARMDGLAMQFLQRAGAQARQTGNLQIEATALNDLGSIHLQAGRIQAAGEAFAEARRIHIRTGDLQGQVYSLLGLGSMQHVRGDLPGALETFGAAEAISRRHGDRNGLAAVRYREALAERDQGRTAQALSHVEDLLALLEVLRDEAGSRDLRSSFTGSRSGYYELYIDLLMQLHRRDPGGGYGVRAFEASERFRAPALLEGLSEVRAAARGSVPQQLLWRQTVLEQQLQEKLRDQIKTTSEPASQQQRRRLAQVDGEIRDLLEALGKLREEMRKERPRYGDLVQPQPSTLREVQELLDDDTALVSYVLGRERSYVWWVERDSLTSRELPGRAGIEPIAQRVHGVLARGQSRAMQQEVPRHLGKLSRFVLDPLADLLDRKSILLVVPDGALQLIPFGALTPSGAAEPLIARHVVAYLPSASAAGMLRHRRAGRRPALKKIAVLADPVFGLDDPRVRERLGRGGEEPANRRAAEDLSRLPHSRWEAEAILGLVPVGMGSSFMGFDASRATALSPALRQHDYLHFAAHGIVSPRQPELSGIQLSRIDRRLLPQNGLLRFYEVYNMDLPVELVTLGACRSAVGPQVRGEGVVGMTRSFLYAGASRVVGSLWDVSDQATAELMTRLYRGILREGKTPAVALREAQLSMRGEEPWSSPYYWAGFVLQGEWH